MSETPRVLRLEAELRRELLARFARRPWPPPERNEDDELHVRASRRILDDLADEPPEGFPDCADWLLVVADERADALRSEPIDARLLVAGESQWTELDEELRERVRSSAVVLRLRLVGHSPAEWAELLPRTAPTGEELSAQLGPAAAAVLGRLRAPGFGELELLQVFRHGPEGWTQAVELSGVLALRPAGS